MKSTTTKQATQALAHKTDTDQLQSTPIKAKAATSKAIAKPAPRTKGANPTKSTSPRVVAKMKELKDQLSDLDAPETATSTALKAAAKASKPAAAPIKHSPSTTNTITPTPSITSVATSNTPTIQSRLIIALQQEAGATLEQMMQLSGWQAHSVRGFISGVVRKKLGLDVIRETREGFCTYCIPQAPGADTAAPAGGVQ